MSIVSSPTRAVAPRARRTNARASPRRAVVVDARRGRKKTSRELDRADAVDDDAMTTDDAPALARVGRDDVLRSCATTSIGMLVVGLGARAASGAFPTRATHGDWNAALPLLGDDAGATAVAALCAAGAVTVGRIALLQVWDEFAASTDRSNAQVLGALDCAGDVAQVAVLPALGEEVLFRGALLPAVGGVPGVVVSSLVFGALHIGGGRSAAFGVWASAVGAVYGVAALHTHSVAAPAAAHALANIASAVYWNATRAEKVIGEKKLEGEDQ